MPLPTRGMLDGGTLATFRSSRMKVTWMANTRTDLLFGISLLSQATAPMFAEIPGQYIKLFNSTVFLAKKNHVSIQFSKLDIKSLRVVICSEICFAGNQDLTSQLGRILLIIDDYNSAVPILYKS